jgi:hypothetical protein
MRASAGSVVLFMQQRPFSEFIKVICETICVMTSASGFFLALDACDAVFKCLKAPFRFLTG